MRANINIHNMDCMDAMKEMEDNQFNLAIVDPPYGIDFAKTYSGKGWIVRESKDWDKETPKSSYFDELFRISENQIIWGGNYFVKHLFHSQGWIFWDKGQRKFSLADGELAFSSYDRALRVFTYTRGRMQAADKNKKHPTQKPVALYKWLLENYAKEGDNLLDTHLGSGSIAIACWDLKFNLTGYELDEEYYNDAMNRFNTHCTQGQLF